MAKEIGIIGLGKFGFFLGEALMDLKQTVIGVDMDTEKIKRAQNVLSQVYQADATDAKALAQLGFLEFSQVVVSVGHSMEASILICLHLKEFGASQVIVKAMSLEHAKILEKMGADKVIIPEHFVAQQFAKRMVIPGFVDYLPMGKGIVLQELPGEKVEGKTLRELNLIKKYGIQVVAIKEGSEYSFIPDADDPLQARDTLILLGREESLKKLYEDLD